MVSYEPVSYELVEISEQSESMLKVRTRRGPEERSERRSDCGGEDPGVALAGLPSTPLSPVAPPLADALRRLLVEEEDRLLLLPAPLLLVLRLLR